MALTLTAEELRSLVERVFEPGPEERSIAVFADLPDAALADTPAWADRRALAVEWLAELARTDLAPRLIVYRNVRANNADLPPTAWVFEPDEVAAWEAPPSDADALPAATARPFDEVLAECAMILAPTQLSTTAPLKVAAPEHGFKAATMPGFARDMIPALRLDYQEINRRVQLLKRLLDDATEARFEFHVEGAVHKLRLDLRHRTSHASGGLVPKAGMAGNLPSGETYMVPYEGELPNDPTSSEGSLPVQLGDDVVIYRIEANRAVAVDNSDDSATAAAEAERLESEPAYGNIAELGLGVLDAFGVEPTGEILLDEKLGLHIAFGRSNHFGGQVGPDQFSTPEAVVHIDRVYIPRIQPRVAVRMVDLVMADGNVLPLMRDHRYAVDFG